MIPYTAKANNIVFLSKAITINSFGGAEEKTIWVEKGTPAPYSGFLTSEDKILSAIQTKLEFDIYKTELDKAYKKIEKLESKSDYEKWLWIGSGIILTVLAGWSLGQVSK